MKIIITNMANTENISATEIELSLLRFLSLKTANGEWDISETKEGDIRVSSVDHTISIIPHASNVVTIREIK